MPKDLDEYRALLRGMLTPARFTHCCNVSEAAAELAALYGADPAKARFAGLVHDVTKDFTPERQLQTFRKYSIILDNVEQGAAKLWHAISGAALLKNEYGVADPDILSAVRYHTTARAGMSPLEKTIYLADFISADRTFDGAEEIRRAAHQSCAEGMHAALRFSIAELLAKPAQIHIDTVKAWNEQFAGK